MKWLIPCLTLLVTMLPVRSHAETTIGPAITSIPYTINKGGVYHLTKNIGYTPASGVAITVNVPQVVIDLNGYQIECVSGSANTATAVSCTNISRVTVKNGAITGFRTGVSLVSNGATVTDLLLTTNYGAGISVTGNNVKIADNRVFNTGGAPSSTVHATGISLTGTDCTVTGNDVQGTFIIDATGHASAGIRLTSCADVILSNNRVMDTQPATAANATATGIATVTSASLIFLSNIVATSQYGFDLSGGAGGEYGDNTTTNTGIPYNTTGSGMTNIGGNN